MHNSSKITVFGPSNKGTHLWLSEEMGGSIKGKESYFLRLNCRHFDLIWWNGCYWVWTRSRIITTREALHHTKPSFNLNNFLMSTNKFRLLWRCISLSPINSEVYSTHSMVQATYPWFANFAYSGIILIQFPFVIIFVLSFSLIIYLL